MTVALRSSFNVTARWLIALFFMASGTAKVFPLEDLAGTRTSEDL
jgi:hypothetical protein